jgi:carbon monoxide dehydrogenase subunit G
MATVHVTKSVEVPAAPADVWAFVSDFAGFASWQPHIESVEMLPNNERKVVFTRGDTKLDRVTSRDDQAMTYSYGLVPGQPTPPGMPSIDRIDATFTVQPAGSGSTVEYSIEADVPDPMEEMAKQGITGDIDGALSGLTQHFAS